MDNRLEFLYEQIKAGRISHAEAARQLKLLGTAGRGRMNPENGKSLADEYPLNITGEIPFETGEPEVGQDPIQGAAQVDSNQLQEKALVYFKNLLADAIKLPAARIEVDAPLDKYGIDSVMAIQLTNQLEKKFGPLPKTLFFEYQNIQSLTGYFLESNRDTLIDALGLKAGKSPTGMDDASKKPRTSGRTIQPEKSAGYGLRQTHLNTPPHTVDRQFVSQSNPGAYYMREAAGPDIAVIGIAGRFPGAANIEEFWENLRDGVDCIVEIPMERWDYRPFYDEEPGRPGKTCCKWGGFLDQVAEFDPLFFNIAPRDAAMMDPLDRLFLETVWTLFESSGHTREKLERHYLGQVGVYVGAMYHQYNLLAADPLIEPATAMASYYSIANRVSYYFNLNGPSLAVDTACSSSAFAIHMACESLRKGECRLAVAGGVNLSLHPKKYVALSMIRMIGSHKNSRSFADGDGYLPGEGVGAVLLKPLANAVRDGDNILAVIKSTNINHGGHSGGYAVPNPNAQSQLFEDNFRKSGIDPRTISYVEAAANGSALGDPIEVKALTNAFRKFTKDRQFCAIGSVKSNIGHTEAASGISQLAKVILQLQHRQLVPSINAQPLNPNIDLVDTPFYLQSELKPWLRPVLKLNGVEQEFPRRATINSFGAGGSNAHIIIEEYAPACGPEESQEVDEINQPQVIIFSARNREALRKIAEKYLEFIGLHPEISLANLAYTLQVGREAMESRLAMVVNNRDELLEGLRTYLDTVPAGPEIPAVIPMYSGEPETDPLLIQNLLSGREGEIFLQSLLAGKKLDKIAMYWTQGGRIPWEAIHEGEKRRIIPLPTYPFQRRFCWVETCPEPEIPAGSIQKRTELLEKADPRLTGQVAASPANRIIDIVCGLLGITVTELSIQKPLYQYGFDSILLMSLYQQLQTQFNTALTLNQLRDFRTTEDIIRVIGQQLGDRTETQLNPEYNAAVPQTVKPLETVQPVPDEGRRFPELVHLNQVSQGRPVFWFHAALGGVEIYYPFAEACGRPFYGIQARGWMSGKEPLRGIPAMASYYIDVIRSVQPEGPYDLGGYSLGGAIAYEVTRQLQAAGQTVNSIVMLDTIYVKRDGPVIEDKDLLWKNNILLTINMMLLTISGGDANARPQDRHSGLIHRDELDISSDRDAFLKQAVNLARQRGLTKTAEQLKTLIQQNIKVQTAYEAENYRALPLSGPDQVKCYYFRNQSRAFYGELEPYFTLTPDDGSMSQEYWLEWERRIRDFRIIDVESSGHLMFVTEPKTIQAVLEFCENMYAPEGHDTDIITTKETVERQRTKDGIQKITILAMGSRGDVQPFIALGKGLKKSGYMVSIAAIDEYRELIINNGIGFAPLGLSAKELEVVFAENNKADTHARQGNSQPFALSRTAKTVLRDNIIRWLEYSCQACSGCDLLIYTGLAYHLGVHVAEKLKVPALPVYLQPVTANAKTASFLMPDLKIGSWYNRLSYRLAEKLLWMYLGKPVNQWRFRQGLQPLSEKEIFFLRHDSTQPVIYGFPEAIFTKPAEWGDEVFLSGYFILKKYDDWQPSPRLARFLEAGPAPVYVGFGSMNSYVSREQVQLILEALKGTGERIILAVGWENFNESDLARNGSDNIFIAGYAPHHWLFPRMKAVIHHGGAGTTAAVLQAGIPSLIIPLMIDQPFWANLAYQLGVSPKPLSIRKLSFARFVKALRVVLYDEKMRRRAKEIGGIISAEDGVINAVDKINQLIVKWNRGNGK